MNECGSTQYDTERPAHFFGRRMSKSSVRVFFIVYLHTCPFIRTLQPPPRSRTRGISNDMGFLYFLNAPKNKLG